jgi:hypothetical protein
MSTSTRDDWRDLSEVTAAHKDPATAWDGSLCQVTQASIDSLKHSTMTHWEFIPDVNGSRLQQFTTLAACCHITLWSFIFIGDWDLVY